MFKTASQIANISGDTCPLNNDLNELTKDELKTVIISLTASKKIASSQCENNFQKNILEQENSRLRKSNVILLEEVARLRECFGYD
jgi:hypothetical protein